ncbi:hypothetical protein EV663_1279 [Rhodovulum bhavnagarense]|uniref:TIGR00725 family protein n=1 Tax=Rhodovulum bhavnagarense TaxID=992286 RepID=A0A4R2R913_9RHOB|nr:TIGR00725 family protein [Rhodovulum bhavnagarense]TCP58427.1 hypothetical protein EV663_1279 [Rhodovulum bhavnagarense]
MNVKLVRQDDGTIRVGDTILDATRWCRHRIPEPACGSEVTVCEAFGFLAQRASLRHLVIGVIGPREASAAQICAAERIGHDLGRLGLTLICGGKTGVMEAVSKGCAEAGGLMIGILPGNEPADANPFVSVPLPTGLGEARNMVIAKSARVLIAIGGSYGTLSEVAYGLHFSKTVIGLVGAPDVAGVSHVATPDAAVSRTLEALIAAAPVRDWQSDV